MDSYSYFLLFCLVLLLIVSGVLLSVRFFFPPIPAFEMDDVNREIIAHLRRSQLLN